MVDRSSPRVFISLLKGGVPMQTDLGDRMISFRYDDEEKKADRVQLHIDNGWLDLLDTDLVNHGNVLSITWGYPGKMARPREVVIVKVTGFQVLVVDCLNRGMLMNKVVRSFTWENMTRSGIVLEIAARYGIAATEVEETHTVYEHVAQGRLTDAQFIQRLAHLEGFVFFVDYDGLHFHKRRMAQQPLKHYAWRFGAEAGEEIENINFDLDPGVRWGKLKVKGYDPLTKKHFEKTASNTETQREGVAPNVEVIDLDTGASQGLKTLASEATQPAATASADDAKKHADGTFTKGSQDVLKMKLYAIGDPDVVAKSIITVSNIGRRFSGPWYVQSAHHFITGGYKLELRVMRDGRHEFGVKTGAAVKKDPSAAKSPDQLTPFEEVDQDTGAIKTVWRDAAGREGANPNATSTGADGKEH